MPRFKLLSRGFFIEILGYSDIEIEYPNISISPFHPPGVVFPNRKIRLLHRSEAAANWLDLLHHATCKIKNIQSQHIPGELDAFPSQVRVGSAFAEARVVAAQVEITFLLVPSQVGCRMNGLPVRGKK